MTTEHTVLLAQDGSGAEPVFTGSLDECEAYIAERGIDDHGNLSTEYGCQYLYVADEEAA